ncbi:MAG: hypothetical protein ACXWCR_13215 [Flavitalea sp.]
MKIILIILFIPVWNSLQAQTYPEPEFSNEVSYLYKDEKHKLLRLEKNSSKQQTNMKAGGLGGMEYGYVFEGSRSPVRIQSGKDHFFIYSISSAGVNSNSSNDSVMLANGIDPSMMRNASALSDPGQAISLYKAEVGKNERKVLLAKSGGMISIGKKANSSSKYTFSVKKIRDGYWELVIDKPLPKGEFAFIIQDGISMSINGDVVLFAFAIE